MMRYLYEAKVIRVVDGSTVDLMVDLGFNIWHFLRVTLHGVAVAPEPSPMMKNHGISAKDYVLDWLLKYDTVFVRTFNDGGHLARNVTGMVFSHRDLRHCLNDDLIDSGLAIPT
jgi:micrococcal nuclease